MQAITGRAEEEAPRQEPGLPPSGLPPWCRAPPRRHAAGRGTPPQCCNTPPARRPPPTSCTRYMVRHWASGMEASAQPMPMYWMMEGWRSASSRRASATKLNTSSSHSSTLGLRRLTATQAPAATGAPASGGVTSLATSTSAGAWGRGGRGGRERGLRATELSVGHELQGGQLGSGVTHSWGHMCSAGTGAGGAPGQRAPAKAPSPSALTFFRLSWGM